MSDDGLRAVIDHVLTDFVSLGAMKGSLFFTIGNSLESHLRGEWLVSLPTNPENEQREEPEMDDLTYICVEKTETRMTTTFEFKRTAWGISTRVEGKDEDDLDGWEWDAAHWSAEGAEPMEVDGELVIEADDDEYEVGRHYAFTPNGPLNDPADDDETSGPVGRDNDPWGTGGGFPPGAPGNRGDLMQPLIESLERPNETSETPTKENE